MHKIVSYLIALVLTFSVAVNAAQMIPVVNLPLGTGGFYQKLALGNNTIYLLSPAGDITYAKQSEAHIASKWSTVFPEGTHTHTYKSIAAGVDDSIAAISYTTYSVMGYSPPSSGSYNPTTPLGSPTTWTNFGSPSMPYTADPEKVIISRLAPNKMALLDTDGSAYLYVGGSVGWTQICNAETATSGCVGFSDMCITDDGHIFGVPKLKSPADTRLYRFVGNMQWEVKAALPITSIDGGLNVNQVTATNAQTGTVYGYQYGSSPSAGSYSVLATGTFQSAAIHGTKIYAVAGTTIYKYY